MRSISRNKMIAMLRDNKGNMYPIETCKYCTDYKGDPKPILPEDLSNATRMPDGFYKYLTCQTEELQDKIIKVTPNSNRTKEINAERWEEERKDLEFKKREAEIRKMHGKLVR